MDKAIQELKAYDVAKKVIIAQDTSIANLSRQVEACNEASQVLHQRLASVERERDNWKELSFDFQQQYKKERRKGIRFKVGLATVTAGALLVYILK